MSREDVVAVVAETWGVRPARVLLTQAGSALPPWRRTQPFVVSEGDHAPTLAWDTPEGVLLLPRTASTRIDDARVAAANRIIALEALSLPGARSPEELASTLLLLFGELGGIVATPEYLHGVDPPKSQSDENALTPIEILTRGDPEALTLFRALSASPILRERSGAWSLIFVLFTPAGGAVRWVVSGEPTGLHDVRRTRVAPDRTFLYPLG